MHIVLYIFITEIHTDSHFKQAAIPLPPVTTANIFVPLSALNSNTGMSPSYVELTPTPLFKIPFSYVTLIFGGNIRHPAESERHSFCGSFIPQLFAYTPVLFQPRTSISISMTHFHIYIAYSDYLWWGRQI